MADNKRIVILELTPESEIGNGVTRRCFVHPQDPNILVKLEKKNEHKSNLQEPKHYRKINERKPKSNLWEEKYYRKIVQKHGEVTGIMRVLGFVRTNMGRGLMVEAIRNADGSLARPIADMVEAPDKTAHWSPEKVYEAVKTLTDRLIAMDIRLFDLNMGNIVLKEDENGGFTAFVIDLKGPYDNKEHIPIANWFPFFARRKLKRRVERLLRRLQGFIPEKPDAKIHWNRILFR